MPVARLMVHFRISAAQTSPQICCVLEGTRGYSDPRDIWQYQSCIIFHCTLGTWYWYEPISDSVFYFEWHLSLVRIPTLWIRTKTPVQGIVEVLSWWRMPVRITYKLGLWGKGSFACPSAVLYWPKSFIYFKRRVGNQLQKTCEDVSEWNLP